MDHFNATISNGTMISTRRGFQVTKQRHKGTSFVNTSIDDIKPRRTQATPSTKSLQPPTTFTFVNDCDDVKAPSRKRPATKSPSRKASTQSAAPSVSKFAKGVSKRRASPGSVTSSPASSVLSWQLEEIPTVSTCQVEGVQMGKTSPRSVPTPPFASHVPEDTLQPLPAWATYKIAEDEDECRSRLAFMCLAFSPGDLCPAGEQGLYEYFGCDPNQSFRLFFSRIRDPTAIQCGVTLGALFDVVRSGRKNSPELESLTSQLCAIINRRIKTRDKLTSPITAHAIATLAILAGYLGKHDHWRVHMRGLLNLIEMAGGQHALQNETINTIRKADICGALSAASSPIIPFIQRHETISSQPNTFPGLRSNRDLLASHLLACGVDSRLIDTVAEVVEFNKCIALTTESPSTMKVRPESALESYLSLSYKILSYPQPLGDLDEETPRRSQGPGDSYTEAVESALRILILLFLRKPAFHLPCGEENLLRLLEGHVRTILYAWQCRQRDPLIDPMILQDPDVAQRPVLIWVCIAGHVYSSMERIDMEGGVYKELLDEVLGRAVVADPNQQLSEQDLSVCRILDLRCVQGQYWTERDAVMSMAGFLKQERYNY